MAKILIAEDDDDISDLALFRLEQEGHQVIIRVDGDSALAFALEAHPDLIILDWMMPGLSGVEVCQRLRQFEPTAAVPILMLTAKAREEDLEVGFSAGVDDYMVKPFSPRELARRVTALLARPGART
jgi:DNA-binding response OmpR family regulator